MHGYYIPAVDRIANRVGCSFPIDLLLAESSPHPNKPVKGEQSSYYANGGKGEGDTHDGQRMWIGRVNALRSIALHYEAIVGIKHKTGCSGGCELLERSHHGGLSWQPDEVSGLESQNFFPFVRASR